TRPLLQRFVHVRARCEPGGRDTEEKSCGDAEHERKEKDAGIEMNLAAAGKICGREGEKRVESPLRQNHASGPTADGEHDAFRKQLPNQSPTTGAERGPNRDLTMTRG